MIYAPIKEETTRKMRAHLLAHWSDFTFKYGMSSSCCTAIAWMFAASNKSTKLLLLKTKKIENVIPGRHLANGIRLMCLYAGKLRMRNKRY